MGSRFTRSSAIGLGIECSKVLMLVLGFVAFFSLTPVQYDEGTASFFANMPLLVLIVNPALWIGLPLLGFVWAEYQAGDTKNGFNIFLMIVEVTAALILLVTAIYFITGGLLYAHNYRGGEGGFFPSEAEMETFRGLLWG